MSAQRGIVLGGSIPAELDLDWRADGGLRVSVQVLHDRMVATTLTPEQVAELAAFVAAGPPRA